MTLPEVLLWRGLRGRGRELVFHRQRPLGPYVLDFFCPAARLAVEVDGEAHTLGDRPERDQRRDRFLAEQGVETFRIGARSVLLDPDWAVEEVLRCARERREGTPRL